MLKYAIPYDLPWYGIESSSATQCNFFVWSNRNLKSYLESVAWPLLGPCLPEGREKKAPSKLRSPLQKQEIVCWQLLERTPQEERRPALGKKGNSRSAYSLFTGAWQKKKQTKVAQTPCNPLTEPYPVTQQVSILISCHCISLKSLPSVRAPAKLWGPMDLAGRWEPISSPPGSPRRQLFSWEHLPAVLPTLP